MLDSYQHGELSVESNHEMIEHLERCEECRGESAARERLRAVVKRVGSVVPELRPGFQDQVMAKVRATPRRSARGMPVLLVAAALVVAAAAPFFVKRHGVPGPHPTPVPIARGNTPGVDNGAIAVAAGTQQKCTLTYTWPKDPPPLEKLETRVDAVFVPVLQALPEKLHGYHVLAAHHCGHAGRSVVHFILRRDGAPPDRLVSVIAMPKTEGSLPPAPQLAVEHLQADGGTVPLVLTGAHEGGFEIASSETKEYLLFVVSAEPGGQNIEIGRRVLPLLAAVLLRVETS